MKERPFTSADVRREVDLAVGRLAGHVRLTPCERSPVLDPPEGGMCFLKMENLQVSGSFKARGAVNKVLSLDERHLQVGVVTASAGNHALGMLHALALVHAPAEIWVAEQISPAKLEALRRRGADLRVVEGGDPGGIESLARSAAERAAKTFVSPYNDPQVIGGQGTVAVELLDQVEHLDAVFVPVGGGGLAAGIAGYLKAVAPHIRIIGCQPANSPIIAASVAAGGDLLELPWEPSLSDGTVGLVEPGAITYPICRDCIDDWVLVSESEIARALRFVMREHCVMIEGAAAVSVAAYMRDTARWAGSNVACVLTGCRIPLDRLAAVLGEDA